MSNENIEKGFVLGLEASARRPSNSGRLLEEALVAVAQAGFKTETIFLGNYDIKPCKGCQHCEATGNCIIRDDMDTLFALVDRADGIIFSSPVYFYSVPGYAKCFIDRFQPYWARKYKLGQKIDRKRAGAAIAVAGSKGEKVFEGIRLPVKYLYDSLFVEFFNIETFPGFDDNPEDIDDEMLKKAFSFGEEYAIFLSYFLIENGG